MKKHLAILFSIALVVIYPASLVSAKVFKYTPAQKLLFDGNHLANVPAKTILIYNFVQKGQLGEFSDTVRVIVGDATKNGGKDLELEFLTGERRIPSGTLPGFHNNAALMMFLQNDVRELEKETGGSQSYFRNRIRYAFSKPLTLQKSQIDFGGKTMSSTEVIIAPYAKDPLGERFKQFADRTYRFVMSDEIPGEIFQLISTTKSPKGGVISEMVMTFVSMEQTN